MGINTTDARLRFREVLEDVAFHNVAYEIRMYGKLRAHLVPPKLGCRTIQAEQIGLVDSNVLREATQILLAKLGNDEEPMSFAEMIDFLLQRIELSRGSVPEAQK